MRLPKIHGVIRRRLLVNFRVDPEVIARHLPPPFRPKPRRDTGSLLNHVAGGRVFPGEHHRATFQVSDTPDPDAASGCFEPGSVGFSATASGRRLDQVVLTTQGWSVAPLDIERVHSSYFADPVRFPPGAATLDCALVMRNIAHEWHEGASLYL